jgi:RNA polymerase sigma-70 factor, ECF subfamily
MSDVVQLDVNALYREHGELIGRVIRRYVGDGPQVDDLLQETFVVAFKQRERFEGRSRVDTWLYGIAANLCRRWHRGQRRFGLFTGRLAVREVDEPAPAPGEDLERRQVIRGVQRALDELPFEQREVVVLFELEGKDGAACAELLGIPEGTVWTRLHKGRQRLKKILTRQAAREEVR